jgi:hypothetical protein
MLQYSVYSKGLHDPTTSRKIHSHDTVCGNSHIVTSDDTTPNNSNIEVKPAEDDECKSSNTTISKRLLHHPTRIELTETLKN